MYVVGREGRGGEEAEMVRGCRTENDRVVAAAKYYDGEKGKAPIAALLLGCCAEGGWGAWV